MFMTYVMQTDLIVDLWTDTWTWIIQHMMSIVYSNNDYALAFRLDWTWWENYDLQRMYCFCIVAWNWQRFECTAPFYAHRKMWWKKQNLWPLYDWLVQIYAVQKRMRPWFFKLPLKVIIWTAVENYSISWETYDILYVSGKTKFHPKVCLTHYGDWWNINIANERIMIFWHFTICLTQYYLYVKGS